MRQIPVISHTHSLQVSVDVWVGQNGLFDATNTLLLHLYTPSLCTEITNF